MNRRSEYLAACLRRRMALLSLLLPAVVSAETLREAWETALASNAGLAAVQRLAAASAAELDAARAEHLPILAASSSASRWGDTPAFDFTSIGVPGALPLFPGSTFTMADVRVSAPLYSGGAVGANVQAAAAAVLESEHAATAAAQDLKLAVAAAYVDVLRAETALAVARASAAGLGAHARDVEDMQRAGQVPRNEYLAAAVALADARQRELERANGVEIARAVYNRMLGRPLDAAVDLAPVAAAAEPATDGLENLVERALAQRAELMGLDAATVELDARAEVAQAARRPQVAVNMGYTFIENSVLAREDYWSVGVGIRWSPFDSGRARHAAAALRERSTAVGHGLDDLRAAIELDVRRAWLDTQSTRERIAAVEGAVAQAEENLRVARDRYRSGEGTNTEVLDAEALLALSAANVADARYDAALAGFRLARALGSL